MKRCVALLLLFASTAMAADLSGKWSGSFRGEGSDHSIPQLLLLRQKGTTLSGTAGPNAGEQYPIENGRVEGNTASFQVTTGEWKFTYNLSAENNFLSGVLKLESPTESRSAKVKLTRLKEN